MNAAALIGANIHKAAGTAKVGEYLGRYWVDVACLHEATIEALCRELNEYGGHGAKLQPGCEFVWLPLGDAEVLVECERGDEDSPPQPINVLINRVWIDVEDHIPAVIVACWCERLFELRAASVEANKRAVVA